MKKDETNGVSDAAPSAVGSRSQCVDDVAREGARDVSANQRTELFERDFVV